MLSRSDEVQGFVDAGNLLFPLDGIDGVNQVQHRIKAELIARTYRKLRVLALNLGPSDVALGADFLSTLRGQGSMPWVSANVRPRASMPPGVARSFLRRVGSVKIGLTGVASPESFGEDSEMVLMEYAPVLVDEIRSLRRRGADVVVVLASLSAAAARALADEVRAIDVIIRSPGTPIDQEPAPPARVGKTLVVEAGRQGQFVGKLRFRFGKQKPQDGLSFRSGSATSDRKRNLRKRKIRAYKAEVEAWKADPNKAEAVRLKRAAIRRLEAELAAPPKKTPVHGPYVEFERISLDAKVPDDPKVVRALSHYYEELSRVNANSGDLEKCKNEKGKPGFVGNQKCRGCHFGAYRFWEKSKHAKAWETLEKDGKHYDLTCVGCHVVGYQKPGGVCRLKDLTGFKDVGCESCHGPGSVHITRPEASTIGSAEGPETCTQQCHVPEHSDAFEYESYVRKITGPGHRRRER